MTLKPVSSAILALLLLSTLATADAAAPAVASTGCPSALEVTTSHVATIGGKSVSYSATVGALEVSSQSDATAKACLFYTSYVSTSGDKTRPIIFAFNGGPGSASLYLHMGALGPKRVDMGPQGLTLNTPVKIVDNADSFIDAADVVMIDPVATGFSAPESGAKPDPFLGVKNDWQSIGQFIRSFIDQNDRNISPVYVMGESYGGIRGSLLANHLQADFGVNLNGLILVSPCLSTTEYFFGASLDDYPYVTFLPNYATIAWYHGTIGAQYKALDVETVYQKAKTFADGGYLVALSHGNSLKPEQFNAVATKVADLTGIDVETVKNLDLRIKDTDYFTDALDKQKLVVGRYDGRFTGGKLLAESGQNVPDPSDSATNMPFISAINEYLRVDLNYKTQSPYVSTANITAWPYDSDATGFGVIDDLGQALYLNPNLRIYIASGYYDLACPMGAVEFAMNHMDPNIDMKTPDGRERVTISKYPAGHMMYINPKALDQLKSELSAWIK